MPFSQKNVRFTSLVIGLVVLCSVMLVCGVVLSRTKNPSPTLYVSAYGFCSTVGLQLLAMVRGESGQAKTRHDIKEDLQPVKMNTEVLVHKLDNGNAPVSRNDLKEVLPPLVKEIVKQALDEREKR